MVCSFEWQKVPEVVVALEDLENLKEYVEEGNRKEALKIIETYLEAKE